MKSDIQSVHFTADKKLIDFINNRLLKLEKVFDHIIDVSIILKLESTGTIKDKVFEAIVTIPGSRLVSSAKNKSFEPACDEAILAMERQLLKVKGKRDNLRKGLR